MSADNINIIHETDYQYLIKKDTERLEMYNISIQLEETLNISFSSNRWRRNKWKINYKKKKSVIEKEYKEEKQIVYLKDMKKN